MFKYWKYYVLVMPDCLIGVQQEIHYHHREVSFIIKFPTCYLSLFIYSLSKIGWVSIDIPIAVLKEKSFRYQEKIGPGTQVF